MHPRVSTTIASSFAKERIGLAVLIAFFCALILIARFQTLVDFPYLAPVTTAFAAQEDNKPGPHKDRIPFAEHQTCADEDDGHDPDRFLLPSYRYPLSQPVATILAASDNIATDWISEPIVPPPRRL
jgi:hypothetical protein